MARTKRTARISTGGRPPRLERIDTVIVYLHVVASSGEEDGTALTILGKMTDAGMYHMFDSCSNLRKGKHVLVGKEGAIVNVVIGMTLQMSQTEADTMSRFFTQLDLNYLQSVTGQAFIHHNEVIIKEGGAEENAQTIQQLVATVRAFTDWAELGDTLSLPM